MPASFRMASTSSADVSMPLMTGIEATERILAWRPDTKVFLVTSHGSSTEIQRGLEAGAVACVAKDDLGLQLVETVLGCAVDQSEADAAGFFEGRLPLQTGRLAASA